jgi:hypothetical protein
MSDVIISVARPAESQKSTDQEITELVDVIRGMQERVGALDAKLTQAKERLRELLEERGSNWEDDEGYARLVSEGRRVTYDTKALDELIISDPLRNGWLKDYRKESYIRGSIKVK